MGEEKIHSLYLQRKNTSSYGPSAYRTVPDMETETCFRFLDGNGNVFLFPIQQLMATETSFHFQPTSLVIMACI
jgi:hypothetical protein